MCRLTRRVFQTVIAATRPSSLHKPEIDALRSRGVDIRALDLENSTTDQVADILQGVDTLISAITPLQLQLQKPLADACKKAGVKRLIPCDWGPASIRGVSRLVDEVRNYVVPYSLRELTQRFRNGTFKIISRKSASDTRSLIPAGGKQAN